MPMSFLVLNIPRIILILIHLLMTAVVKQSRDSNVLTCRIEGKCADEEIPHLENLVDGIVLVSVALFIIEVTGILWKSYHFRHLSGYVVSGVLLCTFLHAGGILLSFFHVRMASCSLHSIDIFAVTILLPCGCEIITLLSKCDWD